MLGKNRILKIIILSLIVVVLGIGQVNAGEMDLEIIQLDGYTNYEIYDNSMTWKSLLEFPLDTNLLSLEYIYDSDIGVPFSNANQKMPFTFNYKFNIISQNDKLFRDSDWLSSGFDTEPIIYAEAKSEISAKIFDVSTIFYDYRFNSSKKLTFGFGYENKIFDYRIYDAFIDDDYNGTVSHIEQDVIDYKVEYNIPYLSANLKNTYKAFDYNLGLTYSPYVTAQDKDYHILRDKTTEGDTKGTMFAYNIGIEYQVNETWYANFDVQKTSIKTEGTQKQTFSDGTVYDDVLTEIYMNSTALTFNITRLF